MEDLEEKGSSRFEPLFINEDEEEREKNASQSGFSFAATQMNNIGLIKPYLKEMDDLLKGCEELTTLPLSSHLSGSYGEMSPIESTNTEDGGKDASQQGYIFTSYIDTNMDGAGTQDKTAQAEPQALASVSSRCGGSGVSCQREMPLTSAGHKLSDTMAEYEGQLSSMLSMLESCIEEAGMDYEPQDWGTESSQEYVHISSNHQLCRGGTRVSVQQERSKRSGSRLMKSEAGQDPDRAQVFEEGRREVTVGLVNGVEQNPDNICVNTAGFSKEQLEKEILRTDESGIDPHLLLSEPSFNTGSMECEVSEAGGVNGTEADYRGNGQADLCAVGSQMEECIQEVQQLEERRKELVQEVLELRRQKDGEETEGRHEEVAEEPTERLVTELMVTLKKEEEERREERKKEMQVLREERAEEERRVWKVNLEMHGLQEELHKLRRRLFAIARDCAHNQFLLNNQHHQVDVLRREEVTIAIRKPFFSHKTPGHYQTYFFPVFQEELESLVLQLTERVSELNAAHKQQISNIRAFLQAQTSSQTSNTQDELTECRRHSCGDIQQFLQGGLRALEDRCHPY